MLTIAIANPKGGVGKTLTTYGIAKGLSNRGYKVLMVDTDYQGNLTSFASMGSAHEEMTLFELLEEGTCLLQNCYGGVKTGFSLVSADSRLFRGAGALGRMAQGEALREALNAFAAHFDFCLIDTPPSVDIMSRLALNAAQKVVIPTDLSMFSVHGMAIPALKDLIVSVKEKDNPELEVEGILITMFREQDSYADLSKLQGHAEEMGTKIFRQQIRWDPDVSWSARIHENYFLKYPEGDAALDYEEFVNEFLGT